MDLWVRKARLFKYGTGTRLQLFGLRGEGERCPAAAVERPDGASSRSGPRQPAPSFGGTTPRAAKMVVVDPDHPDIMKYINWKVVEEQRVAALVTARKLNEKHLKAVRPACVNCEGSGDDCFDPEKNPALRREINWRAAHGLTDAIKRVIQFARQGRQGDRFPDLRHRLGLGSLSHRLSGQNSNNSVLAEG